MASSHDARSAGEGTAGATDASGSGGDAVGLRSLALRFRREADRLVLVRLRIAGEMSRAAEHAADGRGTAEVHQEWTQRQYPTLGSASRSLRRLSESLQRTAEGLERSHARRMGGYQGAGYLGAGSRAVDQVRTVADSLGAHSGARIGGIPLPTVPSLAPVPHASHTLGAPTPDYDEDGPAV